MAGKSSSIPRVQPLTALDLANVGLFRRPTKANASLFFLSSETAADVTDALLKALSDRMPAIEEGIINVLDTIFAPRLLLRHLAVALVLQLGLVGWNTFVSLRRRLLSRFNAKYRSIKEVRAAMKEAGDYDDWKVLAENLDALEGHDLWRRRPDSMLFDHRLLQREIDELFRLMANGDVFSLMFKLRGGMGRTQHGMLHEGLFSRAHAGTKLIVEAYLEAVVQALRFICESQQKDIPSEAKLAFFNETRHAYGRTALMLSGGAAMGIYHVGVVKTLIERGLMPRVISGASAGSIVAAMVATRTDAELRPMYHGEGITLAFFRALRESKRSEKARSAGGKKLKSGAFVQFLVPPALRWLGELFWHMLFGEGLLKMDTDYFRKVLHHNIGNFTFQEAFDHTGRILNITVAPRNRTDPPRLLNYLTTPHVMVWTAAVCSSSVPGVFEPSTLLVKQEDGRIRPESTEGYKYVDGSMEADLPMQQISELFNINHFIVSQVNPHATLLSTMALSKSIWNHPVYSFLVGLVGFLKAQARNWFRNVLEFVSLRRMAPIWATRRGGIQLLTQEYEGRHCDVTIMPWEGTETLVSSFAKMLNNIGRREFSQMVTVSERNTWPKIEMIRCHCAVEMELEHSVTEMRRIVQSESYLIPAVEPSTLRAHGRVPSFYTSRSIVNLAGMGLDVTDPNMRDMQYILRSRSTSNNGIKGGLSSFDVGMSMEEEGEEVATGVAEDTLETGQVIPSLLGGNGEASDRSLGKRRQSDRSESWDITATLRNAERGDISVPRRVISSSSFYYRYSDHPDEEDGGNTRGGDELSPVAGSPAMGRPARSQGSGFQRALSPPPTSSDGARTLRRVSSASS